jgi:hypothetical protein
MASARRSTKLKLSSKKREHSTTPGGYLLCVRNDGYPVALEVHKIYEARSDPKTAGQGFRRVVDESGENYLYPRDFFVPITLSKAAKMALSM